MNPQKSIHQRIEEGEFDGHPGNEKPICPPHLQQLYTLESLLTEFTTEELEEYRGQLEHYRLEKEKYDQKLLKWYASIPQRKESFKQATLEHFGLKQKSNANKIWQKAIEDCNIFYKEGQRIVIDRLEDILELIDL